MLYTKLLVPIKWIKISMLPCLFELQCQFDCSHSNSNTKFLILAHLICDCVSFSLTWSSPATCNHCNCGIILKRNSSALHWYIPYTKRVINNNKYTGLKKVSLLFVSSLDEQVYCSSVIFTGIETHWLYRNSKHFFFVIKLLMSGAEEVQCTVELVAVPCRPTCTNLAGPILLLVLDRYMY